MTFGNSSRTASMNTWSRAGSRGSGLPDWSTACASMNLGAGDSIGVNSTALDVIAPKAVLVLTLRRSAGDSAHQSGATHGRRMPSICRLGPRPPNDHVRRVAAAPRGGLGNHGAWVLSPNRRSRLPDEAVRTMNSNRRSPKWSHAGAWPSGDGPARAPTENPPRLRGFIARADERIRTADPFITRSFLAFRPDSDSAHLQAHRS